MIRREAIREYTTGSLWVLPGVSAVLALLVGFGSNNSGRSPSMVRGKCAGGCGQRDDGMAISVAPIPAFGAVVWPVAKHGGAGHFSPRGTVDCYLEYACQNPD